LGHICGNCGGVRVPDGTLSLFHSNKKNDEIHVHIYGGGRVPDGLSD